MAFETTETFWGVLAGTAAGVVATVRWWYHVRKLAHADKVDGSVSKSLDFVLNELRAEIQRLKLENATLREEVAELKRAKDPYGI